MSDCIIGMVIFGALLRFTEVDSWNNYMYVNCEQGLDCQCLDIFKI